VPSSIDASTFQVELSVNWKQHPHSLSRLPAHQTEQLQHPFAGLAQPAHRYPAFAQTSPSDITNDLHQTKRIIANIMSKWSRDERITLMILFTDFDLTNNEVLDIFGRMFGDAMRDADRTKYTAQGLRDGKLSSIFTSFQSVSNNLQSSSSASPMAAQRCGITSKSPTYTGVT
jgi:hypothetical protein